MAVHGRALQVRELLRVGGCGLADRGAGAARTEAGHGTGGSASAGRDGERLVAARVARLGHTAVRVSMGCSRDAWRLVEGRLAQANVTLANRRPAHFVRKVPAVERLAPERTSTG